MFRMSLLAACVGTLALAGCDNLSPRERTVVGGLTGAAVGMITASALTSDSHWVVVGALTGAVIGTLVARNSATGECAYAAGNGRYRVRACR